MKLRGKTRARRPKTGDRRTLHPLNPKSQLGPHFKKHCPTVPLSWHTVDHISHSTLRGKMCRMNYKSHNALEERFELGYNTSHTRKERKTIASLSLPPPLTPPPPKFSLRVRITFAIIHLAEDGI